MDKQKAALLSVFSNSVLIIFKLLAGFFMGSVSVISEAIHSGIDLLASIVAYFSIKQAKKPADSDHPFGHGKYENISGAFEAILIFAAAAMIIYEAVDKIANRGKIQGIEAGIIVMLISSVVNLVISSKLFSVANKTDSIALRADAMHLFTDVFTSFGVLLGLVIIRFTHIYILDPVIALFVAILIIKASVDLTKKALCDLVDKSLPVHEIEIIEGIINKYSKVTSYHKLRTRKSGDRREIDVHIRMENSTTLLDAHKLCNIIEDEIKNALPNSYITIHIEPENDK